MQGHREAQLSLALMQVSLPSEEFLISLCCFVGSVSKHLKFSSLRWINFFRLPKGPGKKKETPTLFSLLSCPLSTQREEQHNYEKTLMYLNQSEDTTTLCVIEGTLQYRTFKGITCCLGHSLKKGNNIAASAWKSSWMLIGVRKNDSLGLWTEGLGYWSKINLDFGYEMILVW